MLGYNALIRCDIEAWVSVLITWSFEHVVFIIFVSHVESLAHSLEFWTTLFWARNVFISLIDKFLILWLTRMWTFYPCELLYVYWIKSFYVISHFHVFYYINMYIRIESVTCMTIVILSWWKENITQYEFYKIYYKFFLQC